MNNSTRDISTYFDTQFKKSPIDTHPDHKSPTTPKQNTYKKSKSKSNSHAKDKLGTKGGGTTGAASNSNLYKILIKGFNHRTRPWGPDEREDIKTPDKLSFSNS